MNTCSAFTGDTYFNLALNNVVLISDDDGCGSVGSSITYTITQCGTYELREGCFSSSTCSGTTYVSSTESIVFTGYRCSDHYNFPIHCTSDTFPLACTYIGTISQSNANTFSTSSQFLLPILFSLGHKLRSAGIHCFL